MLAIIFRRREFIRERIALCVNAFLFVDRNLKLASAQRFASVHLRCVYHAEVLVTRMNFPRCYRSLRLHRVTNSEDGFRGKYSKENFKA